MENVLIALAIACIVLALVKIFNVTATDVKAVKKIFEKPITLKNLAYPKKTNALISFVKNTIAVISQGGRFNKGLLFAITAACGIIGFLLGIAVDNIFLAIVLCGVLAFIPLLVLHSQAISFRLLLESQLETALNIISSSVMRNEQVIRSIRENISGIPYPLKDVFKDCINEIDLAGISEAEALEHMKVKVQNPVFAEWINWCKKCIKNRTYKNRLLPTAAMLSLVKRVNERNQSEIQGEKRNFIIVACLFLLYIAMTFFVFPNVLSAMVPPVITNLLFAISILLLSICGIRTYLLLKDIRYDI